MDATAIRRWTACIRGVSGCDVGICCSSRWDSVSGEATQLWRCAFDHERGSFCNGHSQSAVCAAKVGESFRRESGDS